MIYQGKARYPVHEVILHTAAVGKDWWHGKTVTDMRDEIRSWHTAPGWQGSPRGWSDIGYHRVFGPLGDMALGRSLYTVGAHCKERNRGTIGLCLINIRPHKGVTRFEDYFTPEQGHAVRDYIAELARLTDLKWVTGHNAYSPKECPGFRVRTEDWLERAVA